MTTQNGWTTIDSNNLDRSPIPGTNVVPVPGVRAGDVATILLHVGKLFNERVALVYNPGCWGWAPPVPIPGSSVISNHGSGTAIDLNAPSFPWKTRNMTPAQREACRGIVREVGVVSWGGDFSIYVDEMHFEIDASEQEVADAANKLRGGDEVVTNEQINDMFLEFTGEPAKQADLDKWRGQPWEKAYYGIKDSPAGQAYTKKKKAQDVRREDLEVRIKQMEVDLKDQTANHAEWKRRALECQSAKTDKIDKEAVVKYLQENLK